MKIPETDLLAYSWCRSMTLPMTLHLERKGESDKVSRYYCTPPPHPAMTFENLLTIYNMRESRSLSPIIS